jgi:hypothetical protein
VWSREGVRGAWLECVCVGADAARGGQRGRNILFDSLCGNVAAHARSTPRLALLFSFRRSQRPAPSRSRCFVLMLDANAPGRGQVRGPAPSGGSTGGEARRLERPPRGSAARRRRRRRRTESWRSRPPSGGIWDSAGRIGARADGTGLGLRGRSVASGGGGRGQPGRREGARANGGRRSGRESRGERERGMAWTPARKQGSADDGSASLPLPRPPSLSRRPPPPAGNAPSACPSAARCRPQLGAGPWRNKGAGVALSGV